MRDCVFALRAADPSQVNDGSCEDVKVQPISDMEKQMMRGVNTDRNEGADDKNFMDLLNDIGDLFVGGRDGDVEATKMTTAAEASRSEPFEVKTSLRHALDSGKKGPIDMMALLAGKEADGVAASRVEERPNIPPILTTGLRESSISDSKKRSTLNCESNGSIDVTALLAGVRGEGDTTPAVESSDETACASKLSKLEERLEAIESKLTKRLKARRVRSSTAESIELMEMRIARIEKLVELICRE